MLLADRVLPQYHIFKAFDLAAVFTEYDELDTELLGPFQFGTEPFNVRLGTVRRQLLKVVLSVDDFSGIIKTHIVTDRERIGNPDDTVRVEILYYRSDYSSFLTAVYDDFHSDQNGSSPPSSSGRGWNEPDEPFFWSGNSTLLTMSDHDCLFSPSFSY